MARAREFGALVLGKVATSEFATQTPSQTRNPLDLCDEAEAAKFKPTLVYVDRENRLTHTNHSMPKQAA